MQKLTLFKSARKERGAISVAFAMGAVILLFLMALNALTHVGNDSSSATNLLAANRAIFAAEAGIETAIADIKNMGTGVFSNELMGDAVVSSTLTGDTLLSVTATVDGITRTAQVVLEIRRFPDPFYYVVSTFNTGKKLKFQGSHSAYLCGNIFSYNDEEIEFESSWGLSSMTVHIHEDATLDNQTSHTVAVEEFLDGETPVEWAALSTTYYDYYINNNGGYQSRDGELDEVTITLSNYPDSVYYSDDTIEAEEEVIIIGPGKLVSSNSIKLYDDTQVGPDVEIISGNDLIINGSSNITGINSILYGENKVDISGSHTSAQGSILSPTFVDIDCASSLSDRGIMQGIVYSGDKAKIRHTRIHGTVIADYIDGEDFHCTWVDYGLSYMPQTLPPGFSVTSFKVEVISGTWRVL